LHQLERYELGELDAAARGAIELHLGACEACKARLDQLSLERKRFDHETDAVAQSVAILARLEAQAPRTSPVGFWRPLAVSLAVALLLVIALPRLHQDDDPSRGHSGVTRIKGEAIALETFVNAPGGPKRLDPDATLTSGDQIQFRYKAGGHRYLMILSIDAKSVSPLYPSEPGGSLSVEPDGLHVLEGSIILDEVVGPERIVALFSDRALDFEEVKKLVESKLGGDPRRIEHLDHLEGLGPGIEQRTVLLHKD
jgi:hypothetical protein